MERFDLFGSIVGLTYKGEMRYRSFLGGLCFLSVLVICLSIILFFFSKFISRDDPKMVLEEEKFWNPPEIGLADFKFIIMMKFDGKNNFYNNAIKVKPLLTRVDQKSGTKTETELIKIQCNETMFPGSSNEYHNLGLDEGICIDTSNLSILGSSVNDIFQYITIRFMLCLNGDECMDSQLLENFIKQQKPLALVYMYDSAFQPYTPAQYTKQFFNSFEVVITFYNAKYSDVFLTNNQLTIEEGIFLSKNEKVLSSIMFDSFRDSVSVRTADQEVALDINFKSSKRKQITHITYLQLSELLANIGAITSNIILIFRFFVDKVNHSLFEKELINEAFKLKSTSLNTRVTTDLRKTTQNRLSIITHDFNLELQDKDKDQGNLMINNYMSGINGTKEKFKTKMVIWYSLLGNCCLWKKSAKMKAFKVLGDKLKEKQDFKNLVLSFQDLELLKYLTLSEQQLNLFDLVKKPLIILDKEKIEHVNNFSQCCFRGKYDGLDVQQLQSNLDILKTKTEKHEIDNKIMSLLKV
jgi:hypothetical protein